MDIRYPKRRIFLSDGENSYRILNFTQDRADSSIYVSYPNYSSVKWLTVSRISGKPELVITDSPGDGYLSLHASGMAKIEPKIHNLVVHGSHLLDSSKTNAGVRHLFTMQLAKPISAASSPPHSRASDYVVNTRQILPIIFIFFAIPRVRKLTVNVGIEFHVDDMTSEPPDVSFGSFELMLHNIVWVAYRTKHMDEWPQNPYICYHDGYLVPVLIGVGDKDFRAEFRIPTYALSESELILKM